MYFRSVYQVQNMDIQKFKTGDTQEFEKIYTGFSDVLFALCLQYTRNRHVSEEIVQDAFVKLWETRKDLDENSNVKNFLYTITKNRCLNYLRDNQRNIRHLDHYKSLELRYAEETLRMLGDDVVAFEELRLKVQLAIDKLPEDLRQIFVMNRNEELKYAEIADNLKVSIKTIEAKMSKALKILRNDLKDYLPFLAYLWLE